MVAVTALGSLPGKQVAAGIRLALEATPDLAWLPEFPARGPWAAIPGRGTALLEGLGAALDAGQWRLATASGIDQRRAKATLRDDLDVLEEQADGYMGALKVSVPGPWTMAATVFRPLGGRVLADRGARADLAGALAEGTRGLLADVSRRVPGAKVVLQVDEPSLPAVLAGAIPTEGGYFRHRAVGEQEVAEALAEFAALADRTLLHSCAADAPVGLIVGRGRHGAGFGGMSLDATLVTTAQAEALASALESDAAVYLGVLGADEEPSVDVAVRRALAVIRPLELGDVAAERLWLTPTCGLAGAPERGVTAILAALRRAAPLVDEALRG